MEAVHSVMDIGTAGNHGGKRTLGFGSIQAQYGLLQSNRAAQFISNAQRWNGNLSHQDIALPTATPYPDHE